MSIFMYIVIGHPVRDIASLVTEKKIVKQKQTENVTGYTKNTVISYGITEYDIHTIEHDSCEWVVFVLGERLIEHKPACKFCKARLNK